MTWDQKANVHKLIFERMKEKGTLIIQHQPLEDHNLPNFFRATLKSEKTNLEDMDYILDTINELGKDIDSTMV